MTITVNVFLIVLLLFALNIILEHLFNWWFRSLGNDSAQGTAAFLVWCFKTAVILLILHSILS